MLNFSFIDYPAENSEKLDFSLRLLCCSTDNWSYVLYVFRTDDKVAYSFDPNQIEFKEINEEQELCLDEITSITCGVCGNRVITKEQLIAVLFVYNLSGESGLDKYLTSCGMIRV